MNSNLVRRQIRPALAEIDIEGLPIEAIERHRNLICRAWDWTKFAMPDDRRDISLECTEAEHEEFVRRFRKKLEARVTRAPRPPVICLCGSTRFWRTFQEQSLRLAKAGVIVLSSGCATASDDEHGITPAVFNELHLRKIDLADEVLVLNVGGYIGESTRAEIDYALNNSKPVKYLEGGGK